MNKFTNYVYEVLLAVDQLGNAILNGDEDMSISARSYLISVRDGKDFHRKWIDLVFFWQTDHCKNAFISEYIKRKEFLDKNTIIYHEAVK